jgi:isopentenyl-diphosphate delta-isomerase
LTSCVRPAESRNGPAATDRKAQQLALAQRDDVLHHLPAGLGEVRLRHRALPGRALDEVETGAELFGAQLRAPLLISSMTGGTAEAAAINRRLVAAASEAGVALALGSGRRLLEDPGLLATYWQPSREERPPVVAANIGATQIKGRHGLDRAERLVSLLNADALFVHLNALQEAIQPEGDTDFGGVAEAIALVVERLDPVPVGVKEVGFGMDADDIRQLEAAGVAVIDVAGAGGTNWALVEGYRSAPAHDVASAFGDWGVATARAVVDARANIRGGAQLVASGGVMDGVDAAKALALGADVVGFARPALLAAAGDRVTEWLRTTIRQLQVATWLTGCSSARDLDAAALQESVPA